LLFGNLMNHTIAKTLAIAVGMLAIAAALIGAVPLSVQPHSHQEHRYRKDRNEFYLQTETEE
jgi:hypothetical protein